ncbi:MAG TPA: hypothetical protein PLD56_12070 [Chitinophagales bacterium]|nr:hypothetical protein [Chitinophagales bacterium]
MENNLTEIINNAYIHDYLYTLFVYDEAVHKETGELQAEYYRFRDPIQMMDYVRFITDADIIKNVALVIIKPRNQLQ